jgi:hypothetical protein
MQLHFGAEAPLQHESWLTGSESFQKVGRRARAGATARFTHSKCGSGGWPGPHFFLRLLAVGSWFLAKPRAVPASLLMFRFLFAYTAARKTLSGEACNHGSEKFLFRKVFPKQIPNIHKAGASRITFALVDDSSERKLRQKLSGDY